MDIMEFLKEYSLAMFLGGSLFILQVNCWQWEFYAIAVPIILLVEWKAA